MTKDLEMYHRTTEEKQTIPRHNPTSCKYVKSPYLPLMIKELEAPQLRCELCLKTTSTLQ